MKDIRIRQRGSRWRGYREEGEGRAEGICPSAQVSWSVFGHGWRNTTGEERVMEGAVRESRKNYLLMYSKGLRGIRRCRAVLEEISLTERASYIHPSGCRENMEYAREAEAHRKELESRIKAYEDMCRRVCSSVGEMEGAEKEAVTLRYIEGLTWDVIAERMGYSVGNIHRIHNRAIDHMVLH